MGCLASKSAVPEKPTKPNPVNGSAHSPKKTTTPPPEPRPPAAPGVKAPDTQEQPLKDAILPRPTVDVKSVYEFGKILGKGQFGTTRLCQDKRTGARYACKSISKRKLQSEDDKNDVRREVQIMHLLAGNQNVVTLKDTFEDKQYVHLVMELCSGGELFDRIVSRGHYSEKDAADMIRTIVKVVAHCHSMGVIHRDLKPENFLLTDNTPDALVKATDFGLSVFFKEGQDFTDIVGSAYYVAPEVLKRRYGKEADIWSCGVILYILLSGVPPFYGDTEQQIFDAVMKGTVDFASDPWPSISEPAKECVRRMLVRDPKKRATADEVLKHDWIRENGVASSQPLESEVLKRIRGFAAMNKLKKEALKIIATSLQPEEITGLKELFGAMDADGSGTITIDELREGLKKKGTKIPESELQRIMENADVNGDGTIDYEEFLAATIHLSKLEREEVLYSAFKHFDADNSGFITKEELEEALKHACAPDHIEEILADVDKDNDGRIDYEEFCEMMRKGNEGGGGLLGGGGIAHQLRAGIMHPPK